MAATCSLLAFPLPVTDCFTFLGAYSVIGISLAKAADIATPCARPSFSMDCTFLPKKGASRATSSGWYSSIMCVTRSNIFFSFNSCPSYLLKWITPNCSNSTAEFFTEIIPYPITLVPGSRPRMIFSFTTLLTL